MLQSLSEKKNFCWRWGGADTHAEQGSDTISWRGSPALLPPSQKSRLHLPAWRSGEMHRGEMQKMDIKKM